MPIRPTKKRTLAPALGQAGKPITWLSHFLMSPEVFWDEKARGTGGSAGGDGNVSNGAGLDPIVHPAGPVFRMRADDEDAVGR